MSMGSEQNTTQNTNTSNTSNLFGQTTNATQNTGLSNTGQVSNQMGWGPAMAGLQNTVIPGMMQWGQTPQQYTGAQYLGPNANMQAGDAAQQAWASGGAQGVANNALDAWQQNLDPTSYLRAPGAFAPLDMYAGEVGRNLERNVRPNIFTGEVAGGMSGGYSSEREQADALARGEAARSIADYGSNLTSNLWQQGMAGRNAALGMAPGMMSLGAQPGTMQYALGQRQRGEQYQQQEMDNARAQWAQMEPMQRLQALGGNLAGYAGLGQTGTMAGTGRTAGTQTGMGTNMVDQSSTGTSETEKTVRDEGSMLGTLMSLGMMGAGLMTGGTATPLLGMLAGGMGSMGGGGGGSSGIWT